MKKLKQVTTNREYNIILKNYKVYCVICSRRSGKHNAYCGPTGNKKNKNWKQYRKTKWK